MHEPVRQRARELANTPEFANAQRQRKKVEALFAELKNQIGLRRLRLRRLKFVREQFFLAAAAQNIKRLVRFLSEHQIRHSLQPLNQPTKNIQEPSPQSHLGGVISAEETFSTPTVIATNRDGGGLLTLRRFRAGNPPT
jgi:hypothetical protein